MHEVIIAHFGEIVVDSDSCREEIGNTIAQEYSCMAAGY